MKKWYNVVAILAVTVIVLGMFALACAQRPAPPQPTGPITIKVGLPTALSGNAAPWGTVTTPAYETWIELFNKEGFQLGGKTYNFKLIQVDDQNTPDGGMAAAKRLIYEEGCKFLAGHWTWNFSAIAAVTNPAKVIFVTRSGASDALPASWGGAYDSKTMPYVVFGTPAKEEWVSDVLAIVEAFPNYKRIGIVDSTLGKGIGWDYADRELDAAGVRYHHEWLPPGTADYISYITKYAEAGCDILFGATDVVSIMILTQKCWDMGYKWPCGHPAQPILDPQMYIAVCGYDATQGFIGAYYASWDFKKTKVNPKYVAMCQETMRIVSEKQGKPYTYTGWIGWLPSHLLILSQAMEKAGTVDDTDAIMEAIRGGTFDTTVGKYTMSGQKTYGSPVVFGSPGCISAIRGDKEVYLSEHPWTPIP